MKQRIFFECSECHVRLKAPYRLIGLTQPCPSCGNDVTIRPCAPAEAEPILVQDEEQRWPLQEQLA